MDIYVMGNWCFIKYGRAHMLAIAPKADVDHANEVEIANMIREAIAVSKFHEIEISPKVVN